MQSAAEKGNRNIRPYVGVLVGMIFIVLTCPFNIFSETPQKSDSIAADTVTAAPVSRPNRPVRPTRRPKAPVVSSPVLVSDSLIVDGDSVAVIPVDTVALSVPTVRAANDSIRPSRWNEEQSFTFVPDPTKAVWMSALFPGLGQLYNRRYWKLPIVIGAYMGLGYATNWNNTMLRDYTRAYSDIMDSDPNTKSYMDFFAPTVKEEDLDKAWLTNLLRTRKNMYRRNRDLCIICMVGVYAIAMIDAYVDAQLAHFDISPDLSVDIAPTLLPAETSGRFPLPGVGFYWALNF
ncbi:MAG: hypothetical protein K2G00_07080 [Duncaniella sp.]|nr:hypothetical protein [Bacteroides sp.]MDE6062496.1 hypothetical protein [Duncaniella sp.]MDE6429610.1 hypothetical protein [Duncaniella sp.]MDE7476015.1 hypothetical protein [Duncaniella sp.]